MSHLSDRLVKALSSGLLLRLVGAFVNLLAVPIALRTLGQERYAVLAALLGLSGWLTIGGFGLGNVAAMSIAALHDDDEASRQAFWQVAVSSGIIVAAVSIAAYVPFELLSARLLNDSAGDMGRELSYASRYCFVAFSISAVAATFEGRYIGMLRSDYCNWVRLVGQLATIVSLVIVARFFDSMLALCVAMTIGQAGSGLWFIIRAFVEFPPPPAFRYSLHDSLASLGQGAGFLASSLATLFYCGGNLPLLAVTLGTQQLATAGVMARLIQMYFSFTTILLSPLGTSLRQAVVSSDAGWIRMALLRAGSGLLGTGALIGCALVGIGSYVVPRWTGAQLPFLSEWLLPTAMLIIAISWSYLWVSASFATRGSGLVAGLAIAEILTIAALYGLLGAHVPSAWSAYIAAGAMTLLSGTILPIVVLRDRTLKRVQRL